jgi:hypothetical protein
VLDLIDGDLRLYHLQDGGWDHMTLGGDRYAVLQHLSDDFSVFEVDRFAVIDVQECWLGFVPWRSVQPQ